MHRITVCAVSCYVGTCLLYILQYLLAFSGEVYIIHRFMIYINFRNYTGFLLSHLKTFKKTISQYNFVT